MFHRPRKIQDMGPKIHDYVSFTVIFICTLAQNTQISLNIIKLLTQYNFKPSSIMQVGKYLNAVYILYSQNN